MPDQLDEIAATRDELRPWAREQLGVTGDAEAATPPLRATMARYGLSWYPIVALGLLAVADTFQVYAFAVLAPEISHTLGVGKGVLAGVLALRTLAIAAAPLPMAALAQRGSRRALLCIVTGVVWSLVAISTGFVVAVWGLVFVLVIDGLTSGSVSALHQPLLVDAHPPEGRMRALSIYQGSEQVGNIVAPLAVAVLVAVLAFTWRGVFVVLGLLSLAAVLAASRLRDPGVGRWDTQRLREALRHHGEVTGPAVESEEVRLSFFEIIRRLLLIPTARRLLFGFAVFGVMLIPLQTFTFFFLDERWNLAPGPRGVFFAYLAVVGIAALALFGRRAEALFRSDPGRPIRLGAACLAASVVLIALAALSPWLWLTVALFGLVSALGVVVGPALTGPLLSVVPPTMRPHASALTGIFIGGVGGLIGALFLSGIDRRFGIGGALVALVVPGIVGALVIASAAFTASSDLDRLIDEILEEEEIRRMGASGTHLPMLACRGIEHSYGPVQVLFGVDLSVDAGEMIALLGVNGAGKSTLLKVMSGVALPSRGTVRFRGADITFLDAERRLRLGITQIPGGRAVFGPLSVVDNLRAYGYTLGRQRRALDDAIDRSFEAFPRLSERRNQPASTLSGGEQQMLALSKALLLRPSLLLIDELSLGLAPLVVDQLLGMVRQLNAEGAAVVLVEQSVSIALDLVERAYFMEKGEIRFEGRGADLLGRDDLLRAVFLDGHQERAPA